MTEVEYLKGKLADTENQLEREMRKEDLREFAEYARDLYDACIGAGFNEEQAWWFTGTLFQTAIK